MMNNVRTVIAGAAAITLAVVGSAAAKPPKAVKLDLKESGYTAFFGPGNLFFASRKEGADAHYLRFNLDGKGKTKLKYAAKAKTGKPPKYSNAPDGRVSPDGANLLYRARAVDETDTWGDTYWLMDLKTQESSAVFRAIRISMFPSWLPDGKRAWYHQGEPSKGAFKLLDVTTGTESDLCAKEKPFGLRVSPDGTQVVGGDVSTRLFMASFDCATITPLAPPDGWGKDLGPNTGFENGPQSMAFSPSGQKLAVGTRTNQLWIFDTKTGAGTKLLDAGVSAAGAFTTGPEWLDDNTILFQRQRKAHPKAGYTYAYDAMAVSVSGGKPEAVLPKNDKCSDSIYAWSLTQRAVIHRTCSVGKATTEWHLVVGTK